MNFRINDQVFYERSKTNTKLSYTSILIPGRVVKVYPEGRVQILIQPELGKEILKCVAIKNLRKVNVKNERRARMERHDS